MNKTVVKIFYVLLSLACVLSLLAACSEKPKPQGGKNDFDLSAAAGISGNRLQQVIEDQKKSASAGGATKEPSKVPDSDETPLPYAIDGSLPETHDPNETPSDFKVLESGGYREALTDSEYKEALTAAKNYAKKHYTINTGTGDFAPASDSDSLYGENLVYSKGNIIVITCRTQGGTMHSIAVARANAQSEFKVVDAK